MVLTFLCLVLDVVFQCIQCNFIFWLRNGGVRFHCFYFNSDNSYVLALYLPWVVYSHIFFSWLSIEWVFKAVKVLNFWSKELQTYISHVKSCVSNDSWCNKFTHATFKVFNVNSHLVHLKLTFLISMKFVSSFAIFSDDFWLIFFFLLIQSAYLRF